MNSSKEISTGCAIVLTLLILAFIGWLIGLTEPKCAMSGCNEAAADNSKYCYLHEISNYYYGNPDYHAVYERSQQKAKANSSTSSSSKSSGSSISNTVNSGTSTKTHNSTLSKKKTYSHSSYDDAYDDVYFNGEPDWDRYYEDEDYANGADDAMDEYEEYGENW